MSAHVRPAGAASGGSKATPTWFGPEHAPLFGVVHVPETGTATAGVVLCPPLGPELGATAHGLRLLATDLADRGLLVLRMDYRGTGHSSGHSAGVSVSDWTADVASAARYLREAGVSEVGLVGVRLGALLAARAAPEVGARALVLWDPVTSGRRQLREERARLRMTVGPTPVEEGSGEVELYGWTLPEGAAAELSGLSLRLETAGVPGVRVLAVLRPGADGALAEEVRGIGGTVNETTDTAGFVAPTEFVPVWPLVSEAGIVDWYLGGADAADPRPVAPVIRETAVIGRGGDGTEVRETLRRVGPYRLFCIETVRASTDADAEASTDADTTPTAEVVFHSTANEPAYGPGRRWPELAREFAADGARCLRFDRRGVGETSAPAPGGLTPLYSVENREDAARINSELALPVARRLHVGLCSGGWMAVVAALSEPGTRMCAISPLMWRLDPPPIDAEVLTARGWDLVTGRAPAAASVERRSLRRLKTFLRTRVPYPVWRSVARTGRVSCPEPLLRALADAGTPATLLFPAGDRRQFELNRGSEALTRIGSAGRSLDLRDLAGGLDDHTLLGADHRRQVADVLRELVAEASR